jgi:hypothetical protein
MAADRRARGERHTRPQRTSKPPEDQQAPRGPASPQRTSKRPEDQQTPHTEIKCTAARRRRRRTQTAGSISGCAAAACAAGSGGSGGSGAHEHQDVPSYQAAELPPAIAAPPTWHPLPGAWVVLARPRWRWRGPGGQQPNNAKRKENWM